LDNTTYETVRCRANKFGLASAANIRRCRGRADCVWRLDEMIVRINGSFIKQSQACFIQQKIRQKQNMVGKR
jgi:transposase-like protein